MVGLKARILAYLDFGEQAEITFRFKNTGNKPLFVISAAPGCGCTVCRLSKNPLHREGEIKTGFDSKKRKRRHIQ